MELRSFEHRDPGELVRAVADGYRMNRQAAYLVVVEDPPTAQRIVYLRRMDSPAVLTGWEEARDELERRLDSAPIPRIGAPGPRHAATVVVVRRGLCVDGHNEGQWAMAWRYAHPLASVFKHGLIVVTEHGWYDLDTHWGESHPALRKGNARPATRHLRAL